MRIKLIYSAQALIILFAVCLFFQPDGISSISIEEALAQPNGPPHEAVSACEVQNVGEVCSFESPKGDLILGTCENVKGGVLACVPEGAHPGGPRGDRPPKAE